MSCTEVEPGSLGTTKVLAVEEVGASTTTTTGYTRKEQPRLWCCQKKKSPRGCGRPVKRKRAQRKR
jgi:hypothetical protein